MTHKALYRTLMLLQCTLPRPGIYTRSAITRGSPALSKDQFYGITQIHVHMVLYTVSYICISAIQKHAM